MFARRNFGLLAALLALVASGCPIFPELGVSLQTSPQVLDFGRTQNQLTLAVVRNASSTPSGPISVTSMADWVTVGPCTSRTGDCRSTGPRDPVTFTISVDRTKLRLGMNRTELVVSASGASDRRVEVLVEDTLQPNFTVDKRRPAIGEAVSFTDTSATTAAAGPILSRIWHFGDGATSTATNPIHRYSRPGVFHVSLTVTTALTTETVVRESFITVVGGEPMADFVGQPRSIAVGDSVNFTDLSTSDPLPILQWRWDFGDGTVSFEQNPVKQYTSPGVYTVSLTVSTGFTSHRETKQNYIAVQTRVAPQANFTLTPLQPQVAQEVQFNDLSEPGSAPITQYLWNFGDGATSTERHPRHTFETVGNFQVTLIVTTAHGTDTIRRTVQVLHQPPTANFFAEPRNGFTGEPIQFADISDPGTAPITSWHWRFGDGSESTQQHPRHAYVEPGTYTVTLTVRTNAAANNTDTEQKVNYIRIINPPTVNFRIENPSAFTGQTINFTNLSSPGTETNITYSWDFGDPDSGEANQSAEENPSHVFASPGDYVIRLTATTPTRSVVTEQTLRVDAAPVPEFSAAPLEAIIGQAVQFTDESETLGRRPIELRVWAFGDGQQSTLENPSHAYMSAGTFTVSLSIGFSHSGTGESFSQTETKEDYIAVAEPVQPVANFEVETLCPRSGLPIQFRDTSVAGSHPITGWEWHFGDGTTSTQQHPVKIYTQPGAYTVRLTVRSAAAPPGFGEDTLVRSGGNALQVEASVALDHFVHDVTGYAWEQAGQMDLPGGGGLPAATAHILSLDSQVWRSETEVGAAAQWQHHLAVIVPANLANTTALLLLEGGVRGMAPPQAADLQAYRELANRSGSVVVVLENVPNQPITFPEEGRARTEHEIVAYSFARFLDEFDAGELEPEWLALWPMTRAVVRAMDATQELLETAGPVEDFVVSGAGLRGWTAWLAASIDCRVRAVAPMGADVLDFPAQLLHHRATYGDYVPELDPYVDLGVFDRIVPPAGGMPPAAQALLRFVDPLSYLERLTMPKLLLNATGDAIFPPDASLLYLEALPGETRVSYLENADETVLSIADVEVRERLLGWYMEISQNVPRAALNFSFQPNNTIVVTTPDAPAAVQRISADNPAARDFRLSEIGAAWTAVTLAEQEAGTYVAATPVPSSGSSAYFVRVDYPTMGAPIQGDTPPTVVYTTPVRIMPEQ